MTATAIPVEVHERILDHLHAEISTLKTCSLVGRAWRPTSRIHLFRKFRVSYDSSSDDAAFDYCSRFEEQALHLVEYVREIYVEDAFATMLGGIMSESHAFARILDRTSTLHRLSISAYCGRHGSTSPWETIDKGTLDGFRTFTVYFPYDDPTNGDLLTSTISALDGVNTSRIDNFRLGGVIGGSIFRSLPDSWLLSTTRLSFQLMTSNLSHIAGTRSEALISVVPRFLGLQDLELSLILHPSDIPHDLSSLETFLLKLLPGHRINSIVTTVFTYGPPVFLAAMGRYFDFCLAHSTRAKVLWEDGKEEILLTAFPELFASGAMEIGTFKSDKWYPALSVHHIHSNGRLRGW
ncbi:hypothetical protein C8J57DRAFT_1723956 [Mycena rebaudengoi]|nr:hypothetical protein C8J57DRAFT_1723956 [Mycena rebaudengoi]